MILLFGIIMVGVAVLFMGILELVNTVFLDYRPVFYDVYEERYR